MSLTLWTGSACSCLFSLCHRVQWDPELFDDKEPWPINIVKEKDWYFDRSILLQQRNIKESRKKKGRKSDWCYPAEEFECYTQNSKLIMLTSFYWAAFMHYSRCEHLTQTTSKSHHDIWLLIIFTMGILLRYTIAAMFDNVCHISQTNLWFQAAVLADIPFASQECCI